MLGLSTYIAFSTFGLVGVFLIYLLLHSFLYSNLRKFMYVFFTVPCCRALAIKVAVKEY